MQARVTDDSLLLDLRTVDEDELETARQTTSRIFVCRQSGFESMMIERLSARHVVLLGIGHTNAHVLRMWKMNPIPDTDLTCISDNTIATYSGMLPAVLAGQNSRGANGD